MEAGQRFFSPTLGWVPDTEIVPHIWRFIQLTSARSIDDYQLWIGTDSRGINGDPVSLVTAVVLRKIGDGGIFFLVASPRRRYATTSDRLRAELDQTREHVIRLHELCMRAKLPISIHVHIDIGRNGDSHEFVQAMVEHAQTLGFPAFIKPNAPAASRIAHRYGGLNPS